jgi:NAD(P)H dehydrogenase (quinone)
MLSPITTEKNCMIVVTGATGLLGRAIVDRLLERLPADQIGVSVREPAKARDLADRGVRVRRGDFTEPSTLATAFAGARQVMLVSGPADAAPHKHAIEAAKTAGAEHIVYTSHMAADPRSLFGPAQGHAQTERDLHEAGVPFTSLRDGFHATSALWMLGDALQTGEIRLPADGPVSWTAHADLADAAVIALTERDRLHGLTPALTGPEALDFGDIGAIASELTGRRITRTVVPDDDYVTNLLAAGTPRHYADVLLTNFTAGRRGEFATVDPTLGRLLGRPPIPFRDVLASALAHTSAADNPSLTR